MATQSLEGPAQQRTLLARDSLQAKDSAPGGRPFMPLGHLCLPDSCAQEQHGHRREAREHLLGLPACILVTSCSPYINPTVCTH